MKDGNGYTIPSQSGLNLKYCTVTFPIGRCDRSSSYSAGVTRLERLECETNTKVVDPVNWRDYFKNVLHIRLIRLQIRAGRIRFPFTLRNFLSSNAMISLIVSPTTL